MVSTIRALRQANVRTGGTLTFVATVGEEGLGDLRGVKQLFKETPAGEVDRFVSIDGSGLGAMSVGVGSLRYRVTFKGPGGHSFAAFGLASPVNALGRAIAKIADFQVSADPKTTFNVGRVGGGTSINAIPSECWMEIDLRSTDAAAIDALDASVQRAVDEAVREENQRGRVRGAITSVRRVVGDRPPGQTSPQSQVVRTALAAARALGITLTPTESSTDANVPIQLKIPAITIGTGGRGTGTHTAGETFDTTDAWKGTQYAVLVTIELARR
jgi:acetylornithine deacetylase/succinyl-diaminopimelate desuccinylase-like protein